MNRTTRTLVLLALGALAALATAAPVGAGVIQQETALDAGMLLYDDELEFDDGFRVVEADGAGGREILFERTTGEQPLRSMRLGCEAESDDLVRCTELAGIASLTLNLVAGEDVADASGVKSYPVRMSSGSGNTRLIGGALGDDLYSDNGEDTLSGGPGDDVIESGPGPSTLGPDRDRIDGGPGRDSLDSGDDDDVVIARDGERDSVICGLGEQDVVIADLVDEVAKDCELVQRPASSDASPPPPPPAPPAPGPSAPAGPPAAQPSAEARLRRVVRVRCVRPGLVRVTARPAGGFAPAASSASTRTGRVVARRRLRHDIRLSPRGRRRATIRVKVTSTDGRRLVVTRRIARC